MCSKRFTSIITPADLFIPAPSQLPGEHRNALKPVGRAALNTLTRSFNCL